MKIIVRATALAAFAAVAAPAFAAFDANIEFDNTYSNLDRGLTQGGRVELNAFGKAGPEYFVAGRASLLMKKDSSVGLDDLWVQVGNAAFDVKLGRFEAANLFPVERDTVLNYAGFAPYQANTLRGRGFVSSGLGIQGPNAGESSFHGALTFNAGGGLSVELGIVEGKIAGSGAINKGIRPVISYVAGPLQFAAGVEAIKYADNVLATDKSQTGFGLTGGYTFGDITVHANYAQVKDALGMKGKSYALVVNQPMGIGGGVVFGDHATATGKEKVTTYYGTYQLPLFDIKGATITPAFSYSKAGGENNAPDDKAIRVRINYSF